MISVQISPKLQKRNIPLSVATCEITEFRILTPEYDFSPMIEKIAKEVKEQYTLQDIKEQEIIALYRSFYWKNLKVDPTKIRPSAEALIKRILKKKVLPKISPFVDAYNLASVSSLIPLGAYDISKIKNPVNIRFTQEGEKFIAIGKTEKTLPLDILVTADDTPQILCRYPYRDAQATMVTANTEKILLIACGAPKISETQLKKGITETIRFLNWLKEHGIITFVAGNSEFISNW